MSFSPFDAALEDDTIDKYNKFLLVCRENGDSISMKLFETITAEEQLHFNYFDNVGNHLKDLGAAYLAQIAGTTGGYRNSGAGICLEPGSSAVIDGFYRPYPVRMYDSPPEIHFSGVNHS